MSLDSNQLEDILEEAVSIVEDAAEIAMQSFRQAIVIETKPDGSPVTAADKKTEERMRTELQKAFPDHGILGEEFGESSPNAEFVWTIDPIDGTRSFITGIPLFGTLLGLLHRGEPIVGVIAMPALGEIYYGAKGLGAFGDGVQLRVSQRAGIEGALISCADSAAFAAAGKTKFLHRLIDSAQAVRGYSDCFGHVLVLRGAVDAMIDPIVSPWDIVPIACLTKEAGGEYLSLLGEQDVFAKSFVSCGPNLKHELLHLHG